MARQVPTIPINSKPVDAAQKLPTPDGGGAKTFNAQVAIVQQGVKGPQTQM